MPACPGFRELRAPRHGQVENDCQDLVDLQRRQLSEVVGDVVEDALVLQHDREFESAPVDFRETDQVAEAGDVLSQLHGHFDAGGALLRSGVELAQL